MQAYTDCFAGKLVDQDYDPKALEASLAHRLPGSRRSRHGGSRYRGERGRASPHRESPQRSARHWRRWVLERRWVKVSRAAASFHRRASGSQLPPARALNDELLDRSWIVSCGDRRPRACLSPRPGRAIAEAVGRGGPHQAGGFVIGDDQRPQFSFALKVALTRDKPRCVGRCGARGSTRRMRSGARQVQDISAEVPIGV